MWDKRCEDGLLLRWWVVGGPERSYCRIWLVISFHLPWGSPGRINDGPKMVLHELRDEEEEAVLS